VTAKSVRPKPLKTRPKLGTKVKYIHTGGQSGSFEESIGKYCFAIVTGRDKFVVNNEGKISVAPLKMENNES
jgi:hypothetical protein